MRRSLILGVMAFVVSSLFGVEPVASWSGFKTETSGSYTAAIPTDATLDTETGVLTLGSTPLSVDISAASSQSTLTVLAQVEAVPESATEFSFFEVAQGNLITVLATKTASDVSTLRQTWKNGETGNLNGSGSDWGATTSWTPTEKHWVSLAINKTVGTAYTLDGAQIADKSGLFFSRVNFSTIYVGRSASGMKVHQLYLYTSKLSQAEVASEIKRVESPNRSATLATGETAWENISWDDDLAPEEGNNINFSLSGDTTLTGVPDTTYATVTITGTGTLKLSGTTLNESALTVGSGITALDTSGLTVADPATLTIPNTCTWTMGSQTFSSLNLLPATKTLVIKGTTSFTGSGGASGIASGRTITVSGSGAVFSTTQSDATGWNTKGTSLSAEDGGKISFGNRETYITPLTLCGGTLETTGVNSGRAIDFFGNPTIVTVNASSSATTTNPTVSTFYAANTGTYGNLFLIRSGALEVTVAENARLDVDATLTTSATTSFGGTPGKLVKKGAGTLVLKRTGTINSSGVDVEAGTLLLSGDGVVTGSAELAVSSGATVEFAGNIAPTQTISGEGTLKLTSGTVNLTGITEGSTFPTVAFAEASTATLIIGTASAFCSQTSITVPENASIHLVLTDEQLKTGYTLPSGLMTVKDHITLYKDADTAITDDDGTFEDGVFTAASNTWTLGTTTDTSFAWTETSHWSYGAIPAENTPIVIEVSNNITLTDVPSTTFTYLKVKGSGTLTLVGATSETTSTPTLNVSAFTVGDNITALNTSGLTIASTASLTIPNTCTWTMGSQTFSSLSLLPATKTLVITGETTYEGSGGATGTGIASGRTITVSGSGAVFSTTQSDATGWNTAGTSLVAENGGKISFGHRESFITPLTLCGGTLETTGVDGNNGEKRAIDFFNLNGNTVTVNATTGASTEEPTVSYFNATNENTGGDGFFIRRGQLNITVAEYARLDVNASFTTEIGIGDRKSGKLVKAGLGTLVLKRGGTIKQSSSGVDVTEGTLVLEGGATGTAPLTVSEGALVEIAGNFVPTSQTISGAGTLKLTSGTVDLRNVTAGDTFPTITFADASTATLILSTTCSLCTEVDNVAPITISGTVPENASIHLILNEEQLKTGYTLPNKLMDVKDSITLYKDADTAITEADGTFKDGVFTAASNAWTLGGSTDTSFSWSDTSHWSYGSVPEANTDVVINVSGDITLTDVPETAIGKLYLFGSGTLTLSGTTLNVSTLTAGDNITALDTSALTVANSATVTIPDTCTWTVGSQTWESYSQLSVKNIVIKGTTSFPGSGGGTGILSGRTITVSGSGATFSTKNSDATGWQTAGTSLIAKDGGKISFGNRETFITPLTLCGGTLETTGVNSNRAIDFWYKTTNPKVWITAADGATDDNPTISYFTASPSDSSDDGRKFLIRDGALTISVDEKAELDVNAVFYTNGSHAFTKQGEGTMVLKRASAINNGSVNVTEGTLKLDGDGVVTGSAALAVSDGATVEFAGGTGTIAPTQTISGAGTLKLTSGTVDLRSVKAGDTFPAITFADDSTATLLLGTESAICSSATYTDSEKASIHLVLTNEQLRSSYTLPDALKTVKTRITLYKDATTAITDEDGTYDPETGTFTATPNTWTIGTTTDTSFAWSDTAHWSRNAVPAEGDLFILTASGDNAITIAGVPATAFGAMTVKGSGTLTLEGTTLNVTSASVESGATLNTEGLTVKTASVAVAADGTWVSGEATLTGSVTGAGAFTVNSGSVSLTTLPDSTLSAITVSKDASLTLASTNQSTISLPNLTGTGTVIFGMTGSAQTDWNNTFTFNDGFTGTTKVTAGYFTLESSTLGSKLILRGGAWQVNSTKTISADIVYESESNTICHVNGSGNATFTGTVTGTKFQKNGSGPLTLQGNVTLDTFTANGGTVSLQSDATIDTFAYNSGTLSIGTGAKTLSIKEVTNISSAVTVPSGVVFAVGKLNRSGAVTFASGSTLKPRTDYTTPTLVAGAGKIVLKAGSTLDLTEGMFTVNGTDTLGLPSAGTVTVKVAKAGQLLATTTLEDSDAEKFTLDASGTTISGSLIPAVKSDGLYAVVVPADKEGETTDTATKEAIAKAAATAGVSTVTEVTAATGCDVAGAALFKGDGIITVTPDTADATRGTVTVEYAFGISKMTLTKSDDEEAQPQVTVYAQIRGKDDSFATITSSSEIVLQTKAIGADVKEFTDVDGEYDFSYNKTTGTYSATVTGVNISNVVFRVLARTTNTTE